MYVESLFTLWKGEWKGDGLKRPKSLEWRAVKNHSRTGTEKSRLIYVVKKLVNRDWSFGISNKSLEAGDTKS